MAEAGKTPSPGAPLACPSCGGPVSQTDKVCDACGALVTLEAALQRAGASAQGRLENFGRRLPRVRPSRQLALLVMAAFPLAVGPAVLAALYCAWALSRAGEPRWHGALLLVALVNIALSLWFWDSFGDVFISRAGALFDQLLARPGARVFEI
ncbi:MAG: hypothetical protein AAF495_25715 [Pseudomonadota bacterium]